MCLRCGCRRVVVLSSCCVLTLLVSQVLVELMLCTLVRMERMVLLMIIDPTRAQFLCLVAQLRLLGPSISRKLWGSFAFPTGRREPLAMCYCSALCG